MSPNKMPRNFSIYKRCCCVAGLVILLAGCGPDRRFDHVGNPFTVPAEQSVSIAALDATYRQYIRQRVPVRLTGTVKYHCQIRGAWAFIEQGDRLAFIDFASSSPNILLSTKKIAYPLVVEGMVVADDTVLNKYHIVPTGFEYQR